MNEWFYEQIGVDGWVSRNPFWILEATCSLTISDFDYVLYILELRPLFHFSYPLLLSHLKNKDTEDPRDAGMCRQSYSDTPQAVIHSFLEFWKSFNPHCHCHSHFCYGSSFPVTYALYLHSGRSASILLRSLLLQLFHMNGGVSWILLTQTWT